MWTHGAEPSNLPLVQKKLVLRTVTEPRPVTAPEPES